VWSIRPRPEFTAWLNDLADASVRGVVVARIKRLELGLAGDVRPVGGGVSELRTHVGAGWRVYFEIAKSAGMTREALYKALRPESAPRFDTVRRVCAALGVRLVVQPAHP
jgi:putative addiction module killer protein